MSNPPADAAARRAVKPLVCYEVDQLPPSNLGLYRQARETMRKSEQVTVPPRDGKTFNVPAGSFFRIVSVDGPQVGDLNLWNAADLSERFFSGKTRQLHATHVSTGDRLWSSLPGLRPLATITHDTLEWYGWDEDGGGVHDVMNVFMCTGFTRDSHQYFMKASPVRPGDYIEFFAEIDLLGALSTCPGGDCGSSHSDDSTPCYPLRVEIYQPQADALAGWKSPGRSAYSGTHGI